MLIIFLAAQTAIAGFHSPPVMREPISAKCLIEVAKLTDDEEKMRSAEYRDYARKKVEDLSGLTADLAYHSQTLRHEWEGYYAQQKDLHENGLITDEEWAGVLAQEPKGDVEALAQELRDLPDCRLLENAIPYPIVLEAKEAAGQ